MSNLDLQREEEMATATQGYQLSERVFTPGPGTAGAVQGLTVAKVDTPATTHPLSRPRVNPKCGESVAEYPMKMPKLTFSIVAL